MQAVALTARDSAIAATVLLAASARSGEEMLGWQAAAIVPTLPAPVRILLQVLPVDPLKRISNNHQKLKATTADVVRMDGQKISAKWFRECLVYDPSVDLLEPHAVRIADVPPAVNAPMLVLTGAKDLQVDPADLEVVARLAGPVETCLVPDLTHSLRRQAGAPSLSKYKQELQRKVDGEVLLGCRTGCGGTCSSSRRHLRRRYGLTSHDHHQLRETLRGVLCLCAPVSACRRSDACTSTHDVSDQRGDRGLSRQKDGVQCVPVPTRGLEPRFRQCLGGSLGSATGAHSCGADPGPGRSP